MNPPTKAPAGKASAAKTLATKPLALLMLLAAALGLGAPAQAKSQGPCQLTVGDTDLAAPAPVVDVPPGGNLSYRIVSPVATTRWQVAASFGPLAFDLVDERFPADGGLERHGDASVANLTRYGGGLYDVRATAELADGTACHAAFQLRLGGSVLRSTLGLAALALLGAGGAAILATTVRVGIETWDYVGSAKEMVAEARQARDESVRAAAIPDNPDGTQPAPARGEDQT